MPAAVRLGDHAAAGGGRIVEEVEQVAGGAGRATKPNVIGTCGRRPRGRSCGRAPLSRASGSGADMPASAPSKMPGAELAHHRRPGRHLVPRRQAGGDRPVVGGLVVLGARRGEADGPGLGSTSSSWPAMSGQVVVASASSSKARSPMAQVRRAECPMLAAKLIPLARPVDGVEVLGEGLEAPVDARRQRGRVDVLGPLEVAHHERPLVGADGRQGEAAVAHHRRGDPVPAGAATRWRPRTPGRPCGCGRR